MTDSLALRPLQIPDCLASVGLGWHPLLMRLHKQLTALASDYRVESIKEKFGGLRVSVADRFDADGEFDGDWADAASPLIQAAETMSRTICEYCGAPGQPRTRADRDGGWIKTVCEQCHPVRRPGTLPLRLTTEEQAAIADHADELGLSTSDYIAQAAARQATQWQHERNDLHKIAERRGTTLKQMLQRGILTDGTP
ncbi:hypothetical protein ACFOOM_13485 [Streptomyces echinoruber]|jgi:uncharacterized protein (DUF1778 family)|uniref:Uncharacterized protein n=1 Tax=Streptomyces echinoruber TaxID=68898 RepID=A0A918VGR4_9ACTN|nr:hypothetical protein [Streptomyces echinoruber]GGZ95585.1 hypothetical protein GCM10010389_38440 [Streptomyces echinoruber]